MYPPIADSVKGRILALGALKWSQPMISKELRKQSLVVSQSTISRVLKNHNTGPDNQSVNGQKEGSRRAPSKCTPRTVRKVQNMLSSDNPLPTIEMARRVGVSASSISRLVNGPLYKKKLKKAKVHHLTAHAILQRSLRALPFYDLIKDGHFMWVFTMDESMLPLDYRNGKTDYFYDSKNIESRRGNAPLLSESPSHPQQRMYAAGYGWKEQSRLYIVEPKAKVDAAYFIEKILSPMMLVDVKKLYGRDHKNIILHMDSARSHTAKLVYDWLDSHGIKYFTKDQWLANSPEVSPMDFFANGYFKSQLAKRKYTTMGGMLKAANEEWEKIPLEMFQNSFRT